MIIRGQAILDFLEGRGEDYKGRTVLDILNWTDEQLEKCHDQVQWTFPLHEESKHAATYPVVDEGVIHKGRQSPSVRHNLLFAMERFERFYGIGAYEDIDKQRRWCKDRDHNLLRITRIIRCLRLFGLEMAACHFYNSAIKAANHFGLSPVTLEYWRKAKEDDVWEKLQ